MNYDKKIIVLSFQRNATQSVHDFLLSSGIPGIHHLNTKKKSLLFKNYSLLKIQKHASIYENEYFHFSDAPYFLMYEYFENKYPDSKFILITRDKNEWLKSFKNLLFLGTEPISIQCFKHYIKHVNEDNILNISDDELLLMYETHNNNVLEYFKEKNSLLHLDIDDPEKAKKISNFLGILKESSFNKIDFVKNL
jgi:hypothetical protein